jgi:anti-anti-sigma factor
MQVKLIQAGDFVTREFPIEVNEFNIGRDYTCDLRLDHGRISRNHCRILKRGNRILVEALYSTAGTAVNNQILDPSAPPTEIYDGDHLWVGPEHFQFVFTGDPNETAAPAERPPSLKQHRPGEGEELSNPLMKDVPSTQSKVAHKLLERMSESAPAEEAPKTTAAPAAAVTPAAVSPAAPPPPVPEPQGTIDVWEMEGVTLVRLLPKALVAESDIRSITSELGELIDSGQSCITLHLGNVERMSSQVIGEVLQVHKRCKSKGGMLKLCKVTPQVASVFAMTNMERHIEIFPDETLALKSIWPQQSTAVAAGKAKAAVEKPNLTERKGPEAAAPAGPVTPAPAPGLKRVRLIVETGKAKGREVEIRIPRFLIGRDQQCQLRPNSNAISRLHAAIEQRDGRVFVRDLDSQMGTVLNGRVLRNEVAEAFHGDRLQIEVLQFLFAIESPAGAQPQVESPAAVNTTKEGSLSGLFGAQTADASADTMIMAIPAEFAAMAPNPPSSGSGSAPVAASSQPPAQSAVDIGEHRPRRSRLVSFQDIDDITVITLRVAELSDESVISAVRVELEYILGEPGRDHIIIRFDHIKILSRGAVVMFLARAQHLIRAQGMMRFSGVAPEVMSFLEKTQLPMLIEVYPTLSEALNAPWGSEEQSGAAAQSGTT